MADVTTEYAVSGPCSALALGKSFQRAHLIMARAALELTVDSGEELCREFIDHLVANLHRTCSLQHPKECRKITDAFLTRASNLMSDGYLDWFRGNEMRFALAEEYGYSDRTVTQERCCLVEPINDFFDDMRARVVSILTDCEAKAFRLGEVLESGLLPIELVTEGPVEGREHVDLAQPSSSESVRPLQCGVHRPPEPPFHITVRLPAECAGLRPWGPEWIWDVERTWRACGLAPPSPDLNAMLGIANADTAARRDGVGNLVRIATDYFTQRVEEEKRSPSGTRIISLMESREQTLRVDGVEYTFDDPDEFLLLADLISTPNRRMNTQQLKANLRIKGRSNRLTRLKTGINDRVYLIASKTGPNAAYWLDFANKTEKRKRKEPIL